MNGLPKPANKTQKLTPAVANLNKRFYNFGVDRKNADQRLP
jgi:hypothetical protein